MGSVFPALRCTVTMVSTFCAAAKVLIKKVQPSTSRERTNRYAISRTPFRPMRGLRVDNRCHGPVANSPGAGRSVYPSQEMKRIITAVILIPLVLVLIFKAPFWLMPILAGVVALPAAWEFLGLANAGGARTPRSWCWVRSQCFSTSASASRTRSPRF